MIDMRDIKNEQLMLDRTLSWFRLNNLGEQTGDKIVTNLGQSK
jgi:hypothetical protein